ncbi:MAG TPA: hypothetical protein VFR86_23680, partial [Burkholderiaceae bacterium]|nr:hypothetical protein [Burkholderiaceae bacterium]
MSAEADSPNDPPGGGSAPQRGGDFWRRAGADVVGGVRTAAPIVRRGAARFGDWLASIGWGKFFFVAFLLFVLVGILNSVLFERGPTVVIDDDGTRDSV